ncbi:MAG TPA: transposase [Candidatus Deferrimicrobium sp.]|nr:transposase [Candidatus Deferrimicrobium sp.]
MARYIADDRCQRLFVHGSLDSLLPENSVARSIWRGLGQLDFSEFDGQYRNDAEGRPAIDPRRLAGVWILALVRGISFSVEVARLCQTDIELRWLSGDTGVPKSTLSDFRTHHLAALGELSTQVLAALARSDLLPGEELAVDGSVIRAAASCRASFTGQQLRRRVARLEQVIQQKLAEPDGAVDSSDRLMKRQARWERALSEMSELGIGDAQRMTISEPEASLKRLKNGSFAPAHSVQVVTDLSSGAIISTAVVDQNSDQGQLLPQVKRAHQELNRVGRLVLDGASAVELVKTVTADAAYHDRQQLVDLESEAIETFVPDDQPRHRRPPGVAAAFLSEMFVYDAETDTMVCPQGHRLRRRKLNAGKTAVTYQAAAAVCQACRCQPQCCPGTGGGRSVNRPWYEETMKAVARRVDSDRGKRYRKMWSWLWKELLDGWWSCCIGGAVAPGA